jgi:DNA transformation protein
VAAQELSEVLDRLAGLGDLTGRPMFGGQGVYTGEMIFGIVFQGRLYLKVDNRSKAGFVARGMGPIRRNGSSRRDRRSWSSIENGGWGVGP